MINQIHVQEWYVKLANAKASFFKNVENVHLI